MNKDASINNRLIGKNYPCFLIGEIGINHNGDIENVFKLIDAAKEAKFDAVKFQKRTPKECVPVDQWEIMRETPWGFISYIDYREKMEFSFDDYKRIIDYANQKDITWFASCWDESSVEFMEELDIPCYKIASASITNINLLEKVSKTKRPVMMSTGMSTMKEIQTAVEILDCDNFLIAHSTSSYPANYNELNLKMINTLDEMYDCPIGYSGHEVGLSTTISTIPLGACFIERHITLSRAMWGTDQSASIEPQGMVKLARDIRLVESALGDGIKKVYDSEKPIIAKLRGKS
tara:strand:+ start:2025 stop:2897 length:873 start_codon:yes stop_codon:yes gene_type:complete